MYIDSDEIEDAPPIASLDDTQRALVYPSHHIHREISLSLALSDIDLLSWLSMATNHDLDL